MAPSLTRKYSEAVFDTAEKVSHCEKSAMSAQIWGN